MNRLLQFDAAAQDGKEQAKADLDKARAKSDLYKGRTEDGERKAAPKVEVLDSCSNSRYFLASYQGILQHQSRYQSEAF